MFRIVVNTEQLKNKSDELKSASEEIHGIQDEINSIISSVDASAYDGQLASAVSGILGGAEKDAARLNRELTDLKDELIRRAGLFERANEATGLSLTKLGDLLKKDMSVSENLGFVAKAKLFFSKFALILAGIGGGSLSVGVIAQRPVQPSIVETNAPSVTKSPPQKV